MSETRDDEMNKLYRERAALVAFLAACFPSYIRDAPDAEGWAIVFVLTPMGQMSWHLSRDDLDLFNHVVWDSSVEWDGHTTAEKYDRLARATWAVFAARATLGMSGNLS